MQNYNAQSNKILFGPILTFLVKECLYILIQPITGMVNLSLTEGVFIDPFNQAIVTPLIYKPSLAKDDQKNYKPVSKSQFHLNGC